MIPRASRLKKRDMEKIIMVIEKSKDFYDAYSENCEGIYAAGGSIDEVKKDTEAAIGIIKRDYPESEWPAPLRGEYEIEWKMDVQSFLEYYKDYLSLQAPTQADGAHQRRSSQVRFRAFKRHALILLFDTCLIGAREGFRPSLFFHSSTFGADASSILFADTMLILRQSPKMASKTDKFSSKMAKTQRP